MDAIWHRINTVLLLLALLTMVAVLGALATGVRGGPLDPPGPPGPTMQTLDSVPPAWFRRLDTTDGQGDGCGSSRFDCVMSGAAVLDRETGLVWERDPVDFAYNWFVARGSCVGRSAGGRYGWRLPTDAELRTLFNPATYNLYPDAPFVGITGEYWTSNSSVSNSNNAYSVTVGATWDIASDHKSTPLTNKGAWCVRGGGGHDWSYYPLTAP